MKALLPGCPEISSAVQDDETEALQSLAAGVRVLEIGSAWGYSAIACALAGALDVTSIDSYPDEGPEQAGMLANLRGYEVRARVAVICAPSGDVLPRLLLAGHQYGLVFIDGDHGEDAVRADIEGSLPLLAPGGRIALHDYGNAPGVKPAADDLFPEGPERLVRSLFISRRMP